MVDDIVERDPDILVLSEAPPLAEMYDGFQRLPGRRFSLSIASDQQDSSHVLPHVRSWRAGLLHLEAHVGIVNGAARSVVIDHPATADPRAGGGRAEQDQPVADPDASRHRTRLRPRWHEKRRARRPDRG